MHFSLLFFIVHLYTPLLFWGLYLMLWASWSWGIARSHHKIVGDKYVYNGIHSSMFLTQSQWNDQQESFCGLCCGKQHKLMLGRLGEPWVCECAPSVSLPYKSDHEWKRGWCHNRVQCRVTSEPLCEKVFGCISQSANNITYSILWKTFDMLRKLWRSTFIWKLEVMICHIILTLSCLCNLLAW